MKKTLCTIALLLTPCAVYAAPGKPSVSGTFEAGQSVTITGTAFGTKPTAAPVVWDNFEAGTNGNQIQNANATVGDWDTGSGSDIPRYSTTRPRTGTLGSYHQFRTTSENASLAKNTTFANAYLDYWMYTTAIDLPSRNWKIWRFYGADDAWQTDYYYRCTGGSYLTTYATPCRVDDTALDQGNSYPYGQWVHVQVMLRESDPSTENGMVRQWINGAVDVDTNNVETRCATGSFNQIRIGHFWATDEEQLSCAANSGADVYIDDVYIDNSMAHIEIGNASTYATSTHREVLIPTAWANTSISATVNTGTFAAESTVYLYVVDANGDVSPASDPIEVGGTATVTCYPDTDEDTYGDINDAGEVRTACESDEVTNHTDCNDNSASIHPGATETCGDSIDQDCSGADLACSSTAGCTGSTTGTIR